MEHLNYFENDLKLQTKFENAVLLFDEYNPDDLTLLHDPYKRNEVIDKYNEYIKALERKTKHDNPATLKDFMLVMNSFISHFRGGIAGLVYKETPHYLQSLENHPEFTDLAAEIESFTTDNNFHTIAQTENIFKDEEDIDWRYKKLYEAYLIMRQYTERGDIDLYE